MLCAVQGPMQVDVTVGNSQYIGFKALDNSMYYKVLAANTADDTAITVSQNDSYGLIGVTFKPTQANIGKRTTFTAGERIVCCLKTHILSLSTS